MNRIDIISVHNTLVRKYQKHGSQDFGTEDGKSVSELKFPETNSDHYFYFYLLRAIPLLDKFCSMKKSQNKIHFVSKKNKKEIEETEDVAGLDDIVHQYMTLVESYFPQDYNQWDRLLSVSSEKGESAKQVFGVYTRPTKNKCALCQNDSDAFSIYDSHFVCEKCGFVSTTTHTNISYKDIDRVNISTKYTYDRRTHFRDCINQYQGKQNVFIDPKVFEEIAEQLRLHGLIPNDYKELPKIDAFKDISKEQILIFLKELGYTKHYEDVVLIHHQLTGKSTPDISHLENDLLRDFDALTDLYDKKYKNLERKNFINTQYVLYQLLRRHKYPCKKEEFNILKTVDRKYYHDTICAELFMTLGWNFQALF